MQAPPIPPSEFDFDEDRLWLMHCAEGPVPRRSIRAATAFLEREAKPWTLRWNEDFVGLPARVRELAARVVGAEAEAEDFTLTSTTSTGLGLVASAFPWSAGDEVLVPLGEFPSNAWPWIALRSRGVTMREAVLWEGHRAGADAWRSTPPPPDVDPEARLLAAIGPRTRLVATSWVRFQDGLRLDLGRLAAGCAERGVRLVVDGIQGAGTAAADLTGVSAFATGGHKGLLAPQGLGFLWTDADFREEIAPLGSWLSVEDAADFSRPSTDFERAWNRDGTRFEQGVPNLLGASALAESLSLIDEAGGGAAIDRHVRSVVAVFLERLREQPRWRAEAERLSALEEHGRLGSIVSLHHAGAGAGKGAPGEAELAELLRAAEERSIHASVREGYLRIAFHGWHDARAVERAAAWLAEAAVTTPRP